MSLLLYNLFMHKKLACSQLFCGLGYATNTFCLAEENLQNKGCPRRVSGISLQWLSQYSFHRRKRSGREEAPHLSRVVFFYSQNAPQSMGTLLSIVWACRMKWAWPKCWIGGLLYCWCTDHGLQLVPNNAHILCGFIVHQENIAWPLSFLIL